MKHIHWRIIGFIFYSLIFCSCSKNEISPSIKLLFANDTTQIVGWENGSIKIQFHSTENWRAELSEYSSSNGWCSVFPSEGDAGISTIFVEIKENPNYTDRNASLQISSKNVVLFIELIQQQKNAIIITSPIYEVQNSGGEIKVGIRSNVDYKFEIGSGCSNWIHNIKTKSLTDSEISFYVAPNKSVYKRSGTIIVTDGNISDTIKVNQQGENAMILIDKNEWVANADGGNFTVDVLSNVEVNIKIEYGTEDKGWLKQSNSKEASDNTYYFETEANNSEKERNAIVVFGNSKYNIHDSLKVIQLCRETTNDPPKDMDSTGNNAVDGTVTVLQRASTGKGIDIVLMGDAFNKESILQGKYSRTMHIAMEKFFMEEPYKSFRDYFNVYAITVVSTTDGYPNGILGGQTKPTLETYFGEGTLVGGNDEKVISYAKKALSEKQVDNALLIVMMNSNKYAGTCYMYYPEAGDYGNGLSISYFPTGTDNDALGQVLNHEAGGHGFAKLADEYSYENNGTVPQQERNDAERMAKYGWYRNVDFTNNPFSIKWAKILSDARYADSGIGIFEGGMTYWSGVWRPSEESIMRHNTGGFNAPSREAIYIRIHKLAFGETWKYDYNKFAEWDAANTRKTGDEASPTTKGININNFIPLHPPIVKIRQ